MQLAAELYQHVAKHHRILHLVCPRTLMRLVKLTVEQWPETGDIIGMPTPSIRLWSKVWDRWCNFYRANPLVYLQVRRVIWTIMDWYFQDCLKNTARMRVIRNNLLQDGDQKCTS